MRALLARLIGFQKHLSERFDDLLPEKFQVDGNTHFQERFAPSHIPEGALVYDVGGGRRPFLSPEEKARRGLRVVGIDIDQEELMRAPRGAYDEAVRADITQYRGRGDADVAICQALLEHVADTPSAFAGVASCLKTGGRALLFAPSRNAVYARVNLMLPENIKRRILYLLHPELEGKAGFPSHYHRCTLAEFERIAGEKGFAVLEKRAYYSSAYFRFFAPLHILWRAWLCAFHLVAKERAAETFSVALRKI